MGDNLLDKWKNDPRYRLLQAEVEALDNRLESKSEFGQVLREVWGKQQTALDAPDQAHLAFYRQVLTQMLNGQFERIVPSDPLTDIDSFGANLAKLNLVLDRKFTEVRALSEIAHEINEGIFIDDVLNHIFETFRPIIPYDRIGFAVLDEDVRGVQIVKARWTRSDFDHICIQPGFHQPLHQTSLSDVAQSKRPRIINDLTSYLERHPKSVSSRLMVKEGVRSSLTCPMIAKGDTFGFMFFSSRVAGAYKTGHVKTFQDISSQLASTLEKSRLYEDLTIRNKFIRSIFGRYISDEIADSLLENPEALKMGGRKCQVTVLMSDIRGFTAMSEHMEPEHVVSALNTCFNVMVDVIHRHNGTIDNIIGDALMVLFGAPLSHDDDAQRAVACALDMQAAMAEVNRRNAELDLPELAIGIGINTGDVVAGNIGSEAHAKYSVIGASVNMAARLESQAGRGEVLISQSSLDLTRGILCIIDTREITVKGFSTPLRAYSIAPR
ncbi:adenylate/guanylate cyclase domain-containing protein [Magnetovibrio sp.]|uniref:adenylate/guanylate cyclase domain-containing protein n=1 Tax=Magnetovibrio sp. TaxID=2024836 RepID=UPI002F9558BD